MEKCSEPKRQGHWQLTIEICVALISPLVPDIFDYLKNLFQLFL